MGLWYKLLIGSKIPWETTAKGIFVRTHQESYIRELECQLIAKGRKLTKYEKGWSEAEQVSQQNDR